MSKRKTFKKKEERVRVDDQVVEDEVEREEDTEKEG